MMKKRKIVPQSGVILRFYGELNDFLPSDQRQVDISVPTDPSVSVKPVSYTHLTLPTIYSV